MATQPKKAPVFAKTLQQVCRSQGKSQRQLAYECHISSSAVNRLCKDGIGSDDMICRILTHLKFKRRRITEILIKRQAELSEGPARNIWENCHFAFLNSEEYLEEISPIPVKIAYASTKHHISLQELLPLAQKYALTNIHSLTTSNMWDIAKLVHECQVRFGKKATQDMFSTECNTAAPILMLSFEKNHKASDYLKLVNCQGRLLFGLPHLVLCDYSFTTNGKICPHRNTGGIEFLYSLEGTFEIVCQGFTSVPDLKPLNIYILNASKTHSISLAKGLSKGRLFMVRFYPEKRHITPGHDRKRKYTHCV